MNFNEVFKVRAVKKNEEDIYVITIGDKLASTEEFETAQKAQMKINKTDWNLVASLFAAMLEGEKKQQKENIKQTEK
jgi:hypothetical protein